jgi:hypothetical protein
MTTTAHSLGDLEPKVLAGRTLTPAEVARVLACPDLVSVGVLGEAARRKAHGDTITFGRVLVVDEAATPGAAEGAGEVRLTARPASLADARARVRQAAAMAGDVPLTAFSLDDLLACCAGDLRALTAAARDLASDGLHAVAGIPADKFASTDALIDAVQAVVRGGLGAWRFTVERAALADRLALINRVAEVQAQTEAGRAFAPLPRLDPIETPSTGYDDVRMIAAAMLRCPASMVVQVDWPLYGPKLAQVAIAYGAGDVDGVAASDAAPLGPRRSAVEDISRQIRAAGGVPMERDGRYTRRG